MKMPAALEFNDYAFRVEGMHCIKCIRKVQAVADHFQTINAVTVDLGGHLVTAHARKDFPVESFVSELESEGFGVFSVVKEKSDQTVKSSNQKMLKKIGVAGACSGNIMILSAAEYAGAQIDGWPHLFKILSLAFFLPIFFYSSLPLYRSSWFALKAKKISIDAPIVLALVGGALLSLYNMLMFSDAQIYFDSLSMFVFFLLASRYVVLKIQSKYTGSITTEDVFSQSRATLVDGGVMRAVDPQEVKVGDTVFVPTDSYLAFDGSLESETATISDAFYSGEAYPKSKKSMDLIFAGSKNLGAGFKIKVSHTKNESRLSKIIEMLNMSLRSRTHLSGLADQGAKLLTILILLASAMIFTYFILVAFNPEEGINRVLALLVVACPCGLAIAAPLVQSLGVKQALKNSLLVKDVSVFESLKNIDSVFFDKTGTLTKGEIKLSSFSPREPSDLEKKIIFNLEAQSEHPIAKALRSYTKAQNVVEMTNYTEEPGRGVRAEIGGDTYSVLTAQGEESRLVFSKNDQEIFYIHFEDQIEPKAKAVVEYFQQNSIEAFILSGDKKREALRVADELGIPSSNVYFEKSPDEKAEIVKNHKSKSLYYGDGINDSLAMSYADVSVSMQSSADVAFKSSNIHILEGGIFKSLSLFDLSNQAYFSMKVIIAISVVYNLFFALLASVGLIKPLIAVIIMPLSSISITFLGLYLMKTTSKKTKESIV
jgi:Cu2+-exporting ATPase/Cu+-exporting ATPase